MIGYWTVSSWKNIGLLKLGWKWGIIETLQDVYGSSSDLYWIYMDLQFNSKWKAWDCSCQVLPWSKGLGPSLEANPELETNRLHHEAHHENLRIAWCSRHRFPQFFKLMFYELKICQHPMYPMFSLHQGWTCWFGSAAIIWFDEYHILIYIYIIFNIYLYFIASLRRLLKKSWIHPVHWSFCVMSGCCPDLQLNLQHKRFCIHRSKIVCK